MINLNEFIVIALVTILSNLTNDAIFMLILNPRMASARIKREIVEDKNFIQAMTFEISYVLGTKDGIQQIDPILNHLQQKLMGTAQGFENIIENPSEIRALKQAIADDAIEAYPELNTILELFPSAKKKIQKNPALIEGFIQYGVPMIERLISKVGGS